MPTGSYPEKAAMLTPSAVTNAKPRAKPYKLADERGLFLLVRSNGSRWWRFKYRRPGTHKENLLSLGVYPDVSLRKARERRDEARRLLADGIDPGDKRKAEQAAGAETFEAIAREWFAKYSPNWAPGHSSKIIRRLELDVFPWIGGKPIVSITAPDVLTVLRRIESRGVIETAYRAKTNIGQVMRYAIATGRANLDPTPSLRGALAPSPSGTMPRSPTPTALANCCAPSTLTRVTTSRARPCYSRRWYSCDPASCGMPSGRK